MKNDGFGVVRWARGNNLKDVASAMKSIERPSGGDARR